MQRTRFIFVLVVTLTFLISGSTLAQDAPESFTIGWLSFFPPDAFKSRMVELGYVEGQNVSYMTVSYENVAPEDYFTSFNEQLQAMVDSGTVDIYVTNTDTDAMNVQGIIGDTPIVFSRSDDPVATGAVADLVTPGGQITGVITNRPHERRLQILTEIKPDTDRILYLYSPVTLEAETVLAQVQAVAKELNVEVIPAQTPDITTAVEALKNTPEGVDWLFLTPYVPYEPTFFEALAAASSTHQAGIAWVTDDAIPGYLVGYGPSIVASDRQAAEVVDRILRGASPAELPVQTAENYLTVNLEAATAIGWEIPQAILRQADLIVRPGYFEALATPAP
ncbi:MAG: ABC transporter substrate-binding protein [Anaerolineae bacterium]|nr:ABC transporter substrate-binding protein [Anaerolineae bacterium]